MRRRDLLLLFAALGGTRTAAARAQSRKIPVVGFLAAGTAAQGASYLAAWHKALAESGFIEGSTLKVEYGWAESDPSRFATLATDLVERGVDVIMATNGPAVRAAKAATTTIPIVFSGLYDPVSAGYVENLNRPGGHITGIVGSFDTLSDKRLQLLHEFVPTVTRIGFLAAQKEADATPNVLIEWERMVAAGKTLGVEVIRLVATKPEEIDTSIAAGKAMGIGAVVVQLHPFMYAQEKRIIEQLARHGLPGARWWNFAAEGGLLSYGPDFDDIGYQAGLYVARILKGARPADLPVVQPTKIRLVINLKTAKALGLTVPQSLLARADEVIE